MYLCIAYDISSNRTRLCAGKYCKKIGMLRLQKSIFIGQVRESDRFNFETEITPLLSPTDRLAIFSLNKETWHYLLQTGKDERLLLLGRKLNVWQF